MCVCCVCLHGFQSINGVEVNGKKLAPGRWRTLSTGDLICFGANIDQNEFKYTLVQDKNGHCSLRRYGSVDDTQLLPVRKKARVSDGKSSDSSDFTQEVSCALQPIQLPPSELQPHTAATFASALNCGAQPVETAGPVPLQSDPFVCAAMSSPAEESNSGKSSGVMAHLHSLCPDPPTHPSPPVPDTNTTQNEPSSVLHDEEKKELLLKIAALKEQLEMKEKSNTATLQDQDGGDSKDHDSSMITSMEEEFTCCICQELFIRAHTLTCAHSFCELCIKEWMKTKMECPICRKKFSSQPVHSLALDNAITKIVDKLGPDRKAVREALVATRLCLATSSTQSATTSGTTHRLSVRAGSRECPITIEVDEAVVVHLDEDDGESDDDSGSDSESSEEGFPGAYYGGYGRCYNCGRACFDCYLNKGMNYYFSPG